MSRNRSSSVEGKIYVGDLPPDASEKEIERAFSYYGHLRNVWVARNPPGFAFVEFEDYRDAEDAVRALDGTMVCGNRVRVEHSTGRVRPKPWMRGGGGGGGGGGSSRRAFHPDDRCYECGDRGHYAYDCHKYSRGGRRSGRRSYSRSRSRSRSRGRRYTRSRSRSRTPTRSKSRSRTPDQRRRSHSRSASRGRDSVNNAYNSDN